MRGEKVSMKLPYRDYCSLGYRDLPTPSLGSFSPTKPKTPEPVPEPEPVTAVSSPVSARPATGRTISSTQGRTGTRKQSFGYEADPWASPDMHKGHNHAALNGSNAREPSIPVAATVPHRTTSEFTTTSQEPPSNSGPPAQGSAGNSEAGWTGFSGDGPPESFGDSGLGSGFDDTSGGDGNDPTGLASLPAPRLLPSGAEEVVTITSLPEKEGPLFFQHRNYQVTSARRGTKVIRRYSDFVWLLDCLHKRYPFRQLPLLPPKRVASKY
jgi:sorting nexin-8